MNKIQEYIQINEEVIVKKAINRNGRTKQKVVAIEELSELQKEICKEIRGIGNTDHIAEEIADVEIMIRQLKIIYAIDDEDVMQWKHKKLKRLDERLA